MNLPLAHHDQVALSTNSRTVRSFETDRERYETWPSRSTPSASAKRPPSATKTSSTSGA
ncbi:MAG: hypothetical protein IPG81_21095 [Sandaracinaceae bacterium]|nr:hypothetical protein [Sandaracinaceae bacterium]